MRKLLPEEIHNKRVGDKNRKEEKHLLFQKVRLQGEQKHQKLLNKHLVQKVSWNASSNQS